MYSLLLLLFLQDNVVQSAPRETVADVKAQLAATRAELKAANEAIAANQIREAQRDKDLANAVEIAKTHAQELQEQRDKVVTLEDKLASTPQVQPHQFNAVEILPITIAGMSAVDVAPSAPDLQWRVLTSPACAHCKPRVDEVRALAKIGWTESQIKVVSLSAEQWSQSGYTLPRAELWSGKTLLIAHDANFTVTQLANEWNDAHTKQEQQLAGMKVGELPVKTQVENLLRSLQPFLDGGKLNITYTPRAGVVKEYLTIKQGSISLMIPARTSLDIAMNDMELSGTFVKPIPMVHLPVRGNTNVKSFTLTPSKFAVQLPWMIDPEFVITPEQTASVVNQTYASSDDAKPQMELDEEIPSDDPTQYAEPRSGCWSGARAKYNRTHPTCEACGSPDNGNIHHVTPFHIDKSLECDQDNLIRLCRDCHFEIGHRRNWKDSNPNVRVDAARRLESLKRLNPR